MVQSDVLGQTALTSYIAQMKDLLGLKDWIITLSDVPLDPDVHDAYITMASGQKQATLQLTPDFLGESREHQRHVITHELLHCHFHETQAIVERTAPLLGMVVEHVFKTEHMNSVEFGVDGVAVAVARLLPLPEVPDEQPPE